MAILRSLLVNLGLNSASYRKDLDKTKRQTKSDFREMAKSAQNYGDQIAKGVTIASAAVATSGALVVSLAKQNRELQINAQLANMAADEYQSMQYTYQQFGLTVDQVSDIYKDSSERIGEWLAAQTGPLQDFGDAMGWTKAQVTEFATSMKDASGQEVLQAMVSQMQAADVSAKEMSFALEGMASEATRMIPALLDNGAAAKQLSDQYDSLNKSLALDPQEVQNYKDLSAAFDLFASTSSNALTKVIAPLADEMAALAEATAFFVASLIEGSEAQLTQELVDLNEEAKEMETRIKYLENRGYSNIFQNDAEAAEELRGELEKNRAEYDRIQKQLIEMRGIGAPSPTSTATPSATTVPEQAKPLTVVATADVKSAFDVYEQGVKEIDSLTRQARAKAQSLIRGGMSLDEQYEEERAFLSQNLDDYEMYLDAKAALDEQYALKRQQNEAQIQQITYDAQARNLATLQMGFQGLMQYAEEGSALAQAAFIASQAVAAAQIMVSAEMAKWQAASTVPNAAAQAAIMGSIDAQKYVSLALVAAQTGAGLAGMAHDGISEVPSEGTWLLDKGERVVDSRTNADLKDFLSNGAMSGSVTVQVMGNIYGDKETQRLIETAANRGAALVGHDAKTNGPIYKQMRR